jgi:hypothetical protein
MKIALKIIFFTLVIFFTSCIKREIFFTDVRDVDVRLIQGIWNGNVNYLGKNYPVQIDLKSDSTIKFSNFPKMRGELSGFNLVSGQDKYKIEKYGANNYVSIVFGAPAEPIIISKTGSKFHLTFMINTEYDNELILSR